MMGNRMEGEFNPEDFSGTERPEFPENGNFEGGEGFEPPADFENGEMPTEPLEGGRPNGEGMKGMGENTLATRFRENSSFSELIEEKKSEYTASIIDSHFASDVLEQYQTLLAEQASDFIDSETLNSEVSTISEYLTNTLSETKTETQETTSEVQ
jgi:spore coat protein CotH